MASSSTTSAIKAPESGEVAEVAAGTERSLSGVTKVQKQVVMTVRNDNNESTMLLKVLTCNYDL